MSDTLPERPTFTSGQYIGAADLNAAVDYARDETRRLALSARTWGIGTGLALVEVLDSSGNVQMFIEPGIAWDGYGRPVVVLSPAPVTPDLFANLSTGLQTVWLRYTATGTQAVAPGFQTCGAGDPTTRVLESYAIEAGAETVQQQTDGVVIAGATVTDPRDMLIAVDQNASVVLDGSVAYQTFADDTGRWLIPVGAAHYNQGSPGTPGTFTQRTPDELKTSRTLRRYMGVAVESLLAADGILRLRDRQTDNTNSLTDTQLDQNAAIQTGDLEADPNTAYSRLVGHELVWVEGNMRLIGNARMFGTQLELRDSTGAYSLNDLAPEFLRRGPAANSLKGQDLQICIGGSAGTPGADRLTIGVLTTAVEDRASTGVDGAISELVAVGTDGKVAIGASAANAIGSYSLLANNLVVASTADTGITVVSDPAKTGNLYFADGTTPTAQMDGYVTYDHNLGQLELGAGAQTVLAVTPTAVVIGNATPASFQGDGDQLIVAATGGGAGITISGQSGAVDRIDFANGTTTFDAGFITYDTNANQMTFGTSATGQVCIDSAGRVGIGTMSPGSFGDQAYELVVASSSGYAGISITAGTAGRIDFANGSSAPHPGYIRYDQANNRMEFGTNANGNVFIDSAGRVGIGTQTPGNFASGANQLVVTTSSGNGGLTIAPASGIGNLNFARPSGGNASVSYDSSNDTITFTRAGSATDFGSVSFNSQGLQVNELVFPAFSSLLLSSQSVQALFTTGATTTPSPLVLQPQGSSVGIGFSSGNPRTNLDMQGSVSGPTGTTPSPAQHLAIFENTATVTAAAAANVLALMVDTTAASDTSCHFVTFYSGGVDVGAIIGGGTAPFNTVTYSTFAADYAEAVPREAKVTKIGARKIVGVRAGKVSLATEGADAVFVTSEAPAILARRPHRDKQDAHETLAFLGQVHVLVDGPVRSGDLIVASGKADGKGRAVALEEVQPEDLAMIVGRAWESVDDASKNGVNAVVGPGVATAAATGVLLARQAREIERLAAQLARRKPPSAG